MLARNNISFSQTHGRNVTLDDDGKSAVWCLSHHTGMCVLNRKLTKGDVLNFDVSGSGHVLVGLMDSMPDIESLKDVDVTAAQTFASGHLTTFRMRNESIKVTLHRQNSQNVALILVSKTSKDKKAIKTSKKDICVFFEIRFGDAYIEMESGTKFTLSGGPNVTFENSQTKAKLIEENYGALCCTNRALAEGEVVCLTITPFEGVTWTYVKLFLSMRSATEMNMDSNRNGCLFPEGGINLDQNGVINVTIKDKQFCYSTADQHGQCSIEGTGIDADSPLFLFVELFRVNAQIEASTPDDQEGFPEIPSAMRGTGQTLPTEHLQPVLHVIELPSEETNPKMFYHNAGLEDLAEEGQGIHETQEMLSADAGASGPVPDIPPRKPIQCSSRSHTYVNQSSADENLLERIEKLERTLSGDVSPNVCQEENEFGNLIRGNHVMLLQKLEPDTVADHLYQERLMTQDEYDERMNRRDRCLQVLALLRTRPGCKDIFIRALRGSPQNFIMKDLGLN